MSSSRAFTLLEMSIVLVIIALILGGVTVGRQLIRNSELQSIIADVNAFKTAATIFRDKYGYLPGDLPTATSNWGTDSACPGGGTQIKQETCNGDGNGQIGGSYAAVYSCPAEVGSAYREILRAWQHLANAQLIKGQYSGTASASSKFTSGVNVPASEGFGQTGYIMFSSAPVDSSQDSPDGVSCSGAYPGTYGHIIEFGFVNNTGVSNYIDEPALSSIDMLSVDKKIDDGIPSSGNVMTLADTDCASAATAPATYNDTEEPSCVPVFVTGF